MSEYEIVDTNAENIGGCGFCGRKDPDNEGYHRKAEWLKNRYPEGLRVNTGSDLRIPSPPATEGERSLILSVLTRRAACA